jgi:replication factor C subunit 3/5
LTPFCPDSLSRFVELSALKTDRGLALQDLITGAHEHIDGIQLPPQSLIYLLDHLATTEYVPPGSESAPIDESARYRLSTGGSEKIQLTALIGAFKNAVELAARK